MATESLTGDSLKILWAAVTLSQPICGLALMNDVKVWFQQLDVEQSIVSPKPLAGTTTAETLDLLDDEDFDESDWKPPVFRYQILTLNPETLATLEQDHLDYCQATGEPMYHGDPIASKTPSMGQQGEGYRQNFDEFTFTGLTQESTEYAHKLNVLQVSGTELMIVESTKFSNFLVPHMIK